MKMKNDEICCHVHSMWSVWAILSGSSINISFVNFEPVCIEICFSLARSKPVFGTGYWSQLQKIDKQTNKHKNNRVPHILICIFICLHVVTLSVLSE